MSCFHGLVSRHASNNACRDAASTTYTHFPSMFSGTLSTFLRGVLVQNFLPNSPVVLVSDKWSSSSVEDDGSNSKIQEQKGGTVNEFEPSV